MSKGNFLRWANENKVLLVCVPLIIGFHWGWYQLQKNPGLVPESKNTEMPIVSALKMYKAKFSEKIGHSEK